MTGADLHLRLDVPPHNDEPRDLVWALNALLQRLDDGFSALETYAANASHELRTPLAVVTSELEVALRRPRRAKEWEQVARTSLDELGRLARLVESLLQVAHATRGSRWVGERFELRERLDQALRPHYASVRDAGSRSQCPDDGAPIGVRGDPELFVGAVHELGLGLAIAKRSVEVCGGWLTLADSPEGGAPASRSSYR